MLDYTYTFTWINTGEQQNYGFIYASSVFVSYKFYPKEPTSASAKFRRGVRKVDPNLAGSKVLFDFVVLKENTLSSHCEIHCLLSLWSTPPSHCEIQYHLIVKNCLLIVKYCLFIVKYTVFSSWEGFFSCRSTLSSDCEILLSSWKIFFSLRNTLSSHRKVLSSHCELLSPHLERFSFHGEVHCLLIVKNCLLIVKGFLLTEKYTVFSLW